MTSSQVKHKSCKDRTIALLHRLFSNFTTASANNTNKLLAIVDANGKTKLNAIQTRPEEGSKSYDSSVQHIIFHMTFTKIVGILYFPQITSKYRRLIQDRSYMLQEWIWKNCMLGKCLKIPRKQTI